MASNKPTLYALLIGIDAYEMPVTPLTCSVADVELMQAYLEEVESAYFNVDIRTLTDGAATKKAMVSAITEQLGRATAGDTALLYFTGHGTRERAQTSVWTRETDGSLECLVPVDGISFEDEEYVTDLLADKELRYLLHAAAKPGVHLVALFDCCHSGDNTRGGGDLLPVAKFASPGMGPYGYQSRSLSEFCFWREVGERAIVDGAARPLAEWLPQGRHVQLSACTDAQVAYQHSAAGYGAFTEALVAELRRTDGKVRYRDLQLSVRARLHGRFDQTPAAYPSTEPNDLYLPFLGKDVVPAVESDPGGEGEISELLRQGTTVYVYADFPDASEAADIREWVGNTPGITVTDNLAGADYRLRFAGGRLNLEHPELNWAGKPLAQPLNPRHGQFPGLLRGYLFGLRRWEQLRQLRNPTLDPATVAFPVSFTAGFAGEPLRDVTGAAVTTLRGRYQRAVDGGLARTLDLRISNPGDRAWYVCLLALGSDFSSSARLLPRRYAKLEPGETAVVFPDGSGHGALTIRPREYVVEDRWPYETVVFKLIVAADDKMLRVALTQFEFTGLPHPGGIGELPRGLRSDSETDFSWGTCDLRVRLDLPTA